MAGSNRLKMATMLQFGPTYEPEKMRRLVEEIERLGSARPTITINWDDIIGKPDCFEACVHGHTWDEITDKPECFPPCGHTHDWEDITNVPDTIADIDCCGIPVRECTDAVLPDPEERIDPQYVYAFFKDDGEDIALPEYVQWYDALIVGGGASNRITLSGTQTSGSGGGGAGAVRRVNNILVAGPLSVVVGAAGSVTAGATPEALAARKGKNSSVGGHTAEGGGTGQIHGATGLQNDLYPTDGGAPGGCGGGANGGFVGGGVGGACGGMFEMSTADPAIRVGGSASAGGQTGGTWFSAAGCAKSGGGGGGAKTPGASITSGVAGELGTGGDGFLMSELGWPDETDFLVNRGTWDSGTSNYIAGDRVTRSITAAVGAPVFPFVATRSVPTNTDPRDSFGVIDPPWRILLDAVGGGGGGGVKDSVYPAGAPGGIGGGGTGTDTNGPANKGADLKGGGAGGVWTGSAEGGQGVVMIRYLTEESAAAQPAYDGVAIWRCATEEDILPLLPENLDQLADLDCCGIIVRECTEPSAPTRPVLGRIVMDKAWLAANHPNPAAPNSEFNWTIPAPPEGAVSADLLVVGGGGPSRNAGGSAGGGGGEVVIAEDVVLTPASTVAVRVGGLRQFVTGTTFATGNDSYFGAIVAKGGKCAGNTSANTAFGNGVGGESGSGLAGGAPFNTDSFTAATGGGAGDQSAGEPATALVLGNGGNGRNVGHIFGSDIGEGGWFGGGGAGGRGSFAAQAGAFGGTGGGGDSGNFIFDADNNTGGGGGGVVGGATDGQGNQSGRSGVIVIQYYGEEIPGDPGLPIWKCIEIVSGDEYINVVNGDAQDGDPTITLNDLPISKITGLQDELDAIDAAIEAVAAAGGGILPMTTGEVPPVLVYGPDGSLIYFEV